ncbi:MAG: tetratricopeptide repeat protein [Thermoplasmatota archaeon]
MARKFKSKDKVLVQLLDYFGNQEKFTQPVEVTQGGLANKLGLKQNTLSYSLRKMVDNDLLIEESHRIEGKKQRRKAYFLTEKGAEKAEGIKKEMANTTVKLEFDGDEKEMKLGDINAYFDTNIHILDLVKNVNHGRLNMELEEKKNPKYSYIDKLSDIRNESIDVPEEMKNWWRSDDQFLLLKGREGIGRNDYISAFTEKFTDTVNVFHYKIRYWQTSEYLLKDMSDFLENIGKHRLSSYLKATDYIKEPEAHENIKRDLEEADVLLIFEDMHSNPGLWRFIKTSLNYLQDKENVRMMISLNSGYDLDFPEGTEPTEFVITEQKTDRDIISNLKNFYLIDGDKEEILEEIFNEKITVEEFLALGYVSIFREDIIKEEIKNLEPINNCLLNNLLDTPFLKKTYEKKLFVPELIRKKTIEMMSDYNKKAFHNMAADYYSRRKGKGPITKIEGLYHTLNTLDQERFLETLEEHGPDIIDNGFSRPLFMLIRSARFYEAFEDNFVIDYFEAETSRLMSNYETSEKLFERIIDGSDDDILKAKAHLKLGTIKELKECFDEAIDQFKSTESLITELEDYGKKRDLLGISYVRLGEIWSKKEDYKKAKDYLQKAIDILLKEEDHNLLSSSYFILAQVEKEKGELAKALEPFKMGLNYWSQIDETYNRIEGLERIGALYKILRELNNAQEYLNKAIEASDTFGYWKIKSSALLSLAECHMENEDYGNAVQTAEEAKEILENIENKEELAFSNAILGKAYMELDKYEDAENYLARSISIYQNLGASYHLGLVYISNAKLQELKDDERAAEENYRKAILSFSGSGADEMAKKVENMMKDRPIST